MAKTKVSATELVWIFQQRLRSFDECSSGTYVAIVPTENGGQLLRAPREGANIPSVPSASTKFRNSFAKFMR
jgi:hypothetical protein